MLLQSATRWKSRLQISRIILPLKIWRMRWMKKERRNVAKETERRSGFPLIVRRPLPLSGGGNLRSSDRESEFRFKPIFFFVATCITHWSRGRKRAPRILHRGIRTGFSSTARLMRKVAFSPDGFRVRVPISRKSRKIDREREKEKGRKPTKDRPTRSRTLLHPRERIWILKCGSKKWTRRYAKTIPDMER